jgi:hypothetical protein
MFILLFHSLSIIFYFQNIVSRLERPCGKLPPKWIINGALNIVRFFAPQLQTNITGPRPYSLTPLGSTPQSLIVHDVDTTINDEDDDNNKDTNNSSNHPVPLQIRRMKCDISMEIPQEEPRIDQNTLIGHASTASSSMQRARYRKKHFDKMYSEAQHHNQHSHNHHHHRSNSNMSKSSNDESSSVLYTDMNKVYTFEFLQHLLSFDDFTIELGSIVGSVPLQSVLNGQPLQIMSSYQRPVPLQQQQSTGTESGSDNNNNNASVSSSMLQNRFWCFDIWHEMLYADAKLYNDNLQKQDLNNDTMNHSDDMDVFCQPSP